MIKRTALLQTAPIALLAVDGADSITEANDRALAMGFVAGTTLASYVSGLDEMFIDHVKHQPETQLYRLAFKHGEKRCQVRIEPATDGCFVWLLDISEQLALADQVRRLKHPDTRRMRQISQLAVTAAGYSELLDVILADGETLESDKLGTVRQYQGELTRNLSAIHQVVGNTRPEVAKGTVLVADQNDSLTELISELLRAEGYKVVGFSDPDTALKYYRVNEHNITKAVVDECLVCENKTDLIATLQADSPTLDVIVLSADEDSREQGKVGKPVDFQVLLEAMET